MFAATVRCGKSPTLWITYPMLLRSISGRSVVMSFPSRVMLPWLGSIRRLIIRSIVDLPLPDGPTRMHSSWSWTVRSSPSTALTEPKTRVTPWKRIMPAPSGAGG